MQRRPGIQISPDLLSLETLHGVLEELVTRDGTELSEARTKIEEVMRRLRRGEVEIWFDPGTRTCSLVASGRTSVNDPD